MVLFASVITSLTAFVALYYGIQQSKNVKLFTIPYFLIEDSWTKQLVVGPLLRIHRPLPFAKNGELLLLGDHYTHNALLLYNIGCQEIKIFQRRIFCVIYGKIISLLVWMMG